MRRYGSRGGALELVLGCEGRGPKCGGALVFEAFGVGGSRWGGDTGLSYASRCGRNETFASSIDK